MRILTSIVLLLLHSALLVSSEPPVESRGYQQHGSGNSLGYGTPQQSQQQQYGPPQQQSQQYGPPQQQPQEYGPPQQQPQQYGPPQQQPQQSQQQQYGPPQQQSQQYGPPQHSQPQQHSPPQQQSQQSTFPQQSRPQQNNVPQHQPQGYTSPQQSQPGQYGPPGVTPGQPLGYQQQQQCPPNDAEANKQLVLKAYQEAFGDKNLANLDKYFAQDYIQHNPMVADGLEGFRKALMGPLNAGPQMQIDFKHVIAKDDFVWTHSRLPLLGMVFAAADIFRVECGKIKEHWDVLQDTKLMMPSANPHPFF